MRSSLSPFLLGLLLTMPALVMTSDRLAPTVATFNGLTCPPGVATIKLSAFNSATGQTYPLDLVGVSLPKEVVTASWPNLLQASHVITGTVVYQPAADGTDGPTFSVEAQTVMGQGDPLPPPVEPPTPQSTVAIVAPAANASIGPTQQVMIDYPANTAGITLQLRNGADGIVVEWTKATGTLAAGQMLFDMAATLQAAGSYHLVAIASVNSAAIVSPAVPVILVQPTPTPTPVPQEPGCTTVQGGTNVDGTWYRDGASGWLMRTVNGQTDYALPGRGADPGANVTVLFFMGPERHLFVQDSRDNLWYSYNRLTNSFERYGPGTAPPSCSGSTTPQPPPTQTPAPASDRTGEVLAAVQASVVAQAASTKALLEAIGALRPPVEVEPALCTTTPLKMVSISWPSSPIGSRTGRWDSGTFTLVEAGFRWMPSLRFVAKDTRGCSVTIVR